MNAREQVGHKRAKTAIAVVLALLAVGLALRGTKRAASRVYYFDIGRGELFAGERFLVTPTDAPSGSENGMRAYVFSCGNCQENDLVTTYIEYMTAEAHQAMMNDTGLPADQAAFEAIMDKGHGVAKPPAAGAKPDWVPISNPLGFALTNAHQTLCGGQPAIACLP